MKSTKRKTKKVSQAKIISKAIQYCQNKAGTHQVDYDDVRDYIKRENLLDLEPISVDEQLDQLMHRVVRTETFTTERGRKVRKYGVPRMTINGEVIALPPWDMRYAPTDIAQTVFDANYENGVNALKRVAIEEDEYRQYSLFEDVLPERNWNLTEIIQEARTTGVYDDSFDESIFEDDDESDE